MQSDWRKAPLTDLYDISSGLSKPASEFGSGFPFVGFKDVFYNFFLPENLTELVQTDEKEQAKCSVERGDVFLTRTSETMHELGMSSVALKDYPNATFNGFTKRLRPKDHNDLVPEYVGYYLRSRKFRNEMLAFSTMSTRASLNNGMIAQLKISFPDQATQREIARSLKILDDKIELNRQMNETLEAMAQALFKSWFVDFDPVIDNALAAGNEIPEPLQKRAAARQALGDKRKPLPVEIQSLFPDRFVFTDEMGWVPEGWEVLAILDVCDLVGGNQPPASTFIEEELEGYVRLIQILDFTNDNHITYVPDSPKLRRVDSDEILIGRYGSASGDRAKDSLGRICRGKSGVYNVALMKLSPKLAGHEYCLRLYDSDTFYGYLFGISNKAVQSGFSKKELGNYFVIHPYKLLLDHYERFGKSIWLKQKQLNKENTNLLNLREALLPKLLSGELRIPDAEKLVAEAV